MNPSPLADERAFRALVEEHAPRLHLIAHRTLGDVAAAEAVVQDAFVRLVRRGSGLQARSLGAWLNRVTVNLCRDELRRRRRARRAVPLELVQDRLTAPSSESGDHVDGPDLWSRVDRLPAKLREILLLRFVSDLSYEELARTLGISTGTVASRLHRALRRLGDELSHLQRNAR